MKQVFPPVTKLLVDKREKDPKLLQALDQLKYPWEQATLEIGDYACADLCCAWERKESDFQIGQIESINRQLANMQVACDNVYLVVNLNAMDWLMPQFDWSCPKCRFPCGRSIQCIKCGEENASYNTRMGFIRSLSARGLTPHWLPNHLVMLHWIVGTIYKNHDTKYRGPGAYRNIRKVTHKDVAKNILLSLPGIGPKMADTIMEEFSSPGEFLIADPKEWMKLKGFGKGTRDKVLDAFWKVSE